MHPMIRRRFIASVIATSATDMPAMPWAARRAMVAQPLARAA